ncbi:MAG TPA: NAD(P)/FAD-dependent oxidoreductase [Myxococcales bacterium]|nr:NAD(P)/FAD-dependent oxidoreductase [Myxococcales bacterium]
MASACILDSSAMDAEVDVAVVGGGVVGCAIASSLARAGKSVLLLEAGPRLAEGVTSRNSGVVHSGLYYAPGSLKARTCVRGNALLYEWARAKGVPHAGIGKLVVARDAQELPELEALESNARAAGAPGIELVSTEFVRQREPSLGAAAALWCPRTGIVDAVELARSFAADAVERGALVLTQARVLAIEATGSAYHLDTARGPVRAERVVNAAGLYADEVAALAGVAKYRIYPWRGDYFRFTPAAPYRHLVYPVRRRAAASLGVHLTLDLAGGCRLGPDVEYVERKDDHSPREDKLQAFLAAARALLGHVRAEQLAYDSCGIRPKLRAPSDTGEKDFVVAEDLPGFVNLVGIESPGLTAALALAEVVLALIA